MTIRRLQSLGIRVPATWVLRRCRLREPSRWEERAARRYLACDPDRARATDHTPPFHLEPRSWGDRLVDVAADAPSLEAHKRPGPLFTPRYTDT